MATRDPEGRIIISDGEQLAIARARRSSVGEEAILVNIIDRMGAEIARGPDPAKWVARDPRPLGPVEGGIVSLSAHEESLLKRLRDGDAEGREMTLLAIIDRQFEEIAAFESAMVEHGKEQLDLWVKLATDALATWIKEKLIAETRERAEAHRLAVHGDPDAYPPLGVMVISEEDCRPLPFAEPVVVVIPAADEATEPVDPDTLPADLSPVNLRVWMQDAFGLCGCSELARCVVELRGLLEWCGAKPKERGGWEDLYKPEAVFYFMVGALDRLGLAEHGVAVRHPFLTPEGKRLLEALRATTGEAIAEAETT